MVHPPGALLTRFPETLLPPPPLSEVLQVVWLSIMRSINMTGKNQQQVFQVGAVGAIGFGEAGY